MSTVPLATLGQPQFRVSRAITEADTGTTAAIVEIPAKSFVPPYGISIRISEAFAGGSPSIDIGDGDAATGWIASADITEGTTGIYTGQAGNSATAKNGKYYASADTIDAVVSASLTNGTAYLLVTYYDLSDVF